MSNWTKALKLKLTSAERWEWYLKAEYGLTLAQYEALRVGQRGKCAICGALGRLCVDHCHKTGKVRGLLCSQCNYSLVGAIEKNGLKNTEKALKYLKNSKK